MNNLLVRVYLIKVTSRTLLALQKILDGSVEDSANLIVHKEEFKSKLLSLEEEKLEIGKIIKEIEKDNEVEYIWFYL
jgi:hypothetical protein